MNKLPIIIDNFISEDLQDKIEDSMFDCSWIFKMDNTSNYNPKLMGMKYRKFLNPFEYDISPSIISNYKENDKAYKLFHSVIEKTCKHVDFKLQKVHRCYAGIQGVQVIREKNKRCAIHVNQKIPHLVLLYYVNDSDGETTLYDKTVDDFKDDNLMNFNPVHKINPQRGRILLFDGRVYHSATSPTKGVRCIITSDIYGKFEDECYNFSVNQTYIKNKFNYS